MTELSDTSPEAGRILLDLYRKMDPEEKLRVVFEHQAFVESISMAGIRMRHPHADEREVTLRLAALRYPRELMVRVFGWDPVVKGY